MALERTLGGKEAGHGGGIRGGHARHVAVLVQRGAVHGHEEGRVPALGQQLSRRRGPRAADGRPDPSP